MTRRVTVLHDVIRWEEKALVEAARRAGVEAAAVDCRGLSLDLDGPPPGYGVVLQRCVSYYRSVHSTAALEGMGCEVVNPLGAAVRAGNKLYTHMLLRGRGVPAPRARASFSAEAALRGLGEMGYPAVIKPTVGSWGRMVSRLTGAEAAEGLLAMREAMYPIHQVHYTEEFVRRRPRDIRAIVIGGRVAAAIYRSAGDGGWKTNMALGGRAEACEVTGELEDVCARACEAVGGRIVGVDLMEDDERGLVVHEVNNTTEFKNTVRVCGVDVPRLMVEHAAGAG